MKPASREQLSYPDKAPAHQGFEARLKQIEALTGTDLLARYAHPKGHQPVWKATKLRADWDEGQFTLGRAKSFRRAIKPIMEFSAAEIGSFEIIRVPDDYLTPIAHLAQMALAVSFVFDIVEQFSDAPNYLGWGAAVVVCAIYLIATAAARSTQAPAVRLSLSSPSSEHTWVEFRKRDFGLSTDSKETRKLADQIAGTLGKSGFHGGMPSELTYDPVWKVNRVIPFMRNGMVMGLVVIKLGVEMIPPIVQTLSYWIERLFP